MLIKQGEGKIIKIISEDELLELSPKKIKKVLSATQPKSNNKKATVSEKK